MKIALIPLVTLLTLTSFGALAADSPPSDRAAACQADVSKFCAGVQPGGHRITACLRQNKGKLSQECRDAMAKGRATKAPPSVSVPKG